MMSENDPHYQVALEEWRAHHAHETGHHSSGLAPLLVGSLAVAGLGALAWFYLGPDLKRCMKLRDI